MKKRGLIFLSTCMLLFVTMSYAKPVDKKTALKVLEQFSKIEFKNRSKALQPAAMNSYKEIKSDNVVMMHVFYGQNSFAIISADDRAYPVLGYSTESTFPTESENPALTWWINGYKQQIEGEIQSKRSTSNNVTKIWEKYLDESKSSNANEVSSKAGFVLLDVNTRWNQGIYYNDSCPAHPAAPASFNHRCPTGCVATTMAQIMKYWNYPSEGIGSHSYNHPAFGILSANFGNTQYAWNNMTDVANSSSAPFISQLMYHCGVAVDMAYTPAESGSFSQDVPYALYTFFKYRRFVKQEMRYNFPDDQWHDIVRGNLDAGYPVYYSGSDASVGGHAWVCDGYSSGDMFHMNWGWGGSGDGNFKLSALNPGASGTSQGNGNFILNQGVVVNIVPDLDSNPLCIPLRTYRATAGSFDDGSGSWNYSDNADCKWLIKPDSIVNYIQLKIDYCQLDNGDSLIIYDGETESSSNIRYLTQNYSMSDSLIQTPFIASQGKVLIRFVTNESGNNNGWKITYTRDSDVGIEESDAPVFNLYPNPTNDKITIDFASQTNAKREVVVLDPSGRVLFREAPSVNKEKIEVSLKGLTSGIYFIQVKEGSAVSMKKVMKM